MGQYYLAHTLQDQYLKTLFCSQQHKNKMDRFGYILSESYV